MDARPIQLPFEYKVKGRLGAGAFAQVDLIEWHAHDLALKKIYCRREDEFEEARREVAILNRLKHPNIVRMHHVNETSFSVEIVLDYMNAGDLLHVISRFPETLTPAVVYHITLDICNGLKHIHAQHVIHRDLKTANILLHQVPGSATLQAVIGDFGSSRFIHDAESEERIRGTPAYMAPELWKRYATSEKTDNWSLGLILYAIVMKEEPYANAGSLFVIATLSQKTHLEDSLPVDCPGYLRAAIANCLVHDANDRPTSDDLHEHVHNSRAAALTEEIEEHAVSVSRLGLLSGSSVLNLQGGSLRGKPKEEVDEGRLICTIR